MEARITGIDRGEALRYLRCREGSEPAEVRALLERAEARLLAVARPRCVWKLFDLSPEGVLAGTEFYPQGADIRAFLASCDQVIVMGATLGAESEALLRRTQARNMAEAVVLDACASAAVENVCDNLCADLAELFAPRYLTDRYSPGYGDFPFSQQREVFAVLDMTRRIGVSLTESGLMLPQKSVTALIGVSDLPQPKRRRGCESCSNYETCAYRKEGKPCGAN